MIENRHKELANYRMNKALEDLSTSRQLFQLGKYRDAVSKSYYSILTAMRALLSLFHQDSQRHEGVITLFHQLLIKPGFIPKSFNKIIRDLKTSREDADYGDFIEISREAASKEIQHAEEFLKVAEKVFTKLLTGHER